MTDCAETLLLIGASGHARAVAEVIRAEGNYRILGLIDSFQPAGTGCFGYPVLGGEAEIPALCETLNNRHIIVAIGDNYQRQAMSERIMENTPGVVFPTVVHPSAVLAPDVRSGWGCVIMPGVIVVSGCSLGNGCLLNTGAILEHDGTMEDWSSLGPGVTAGGNLVLGRRSAVNLGAQVIHKIRIGRDTLVGAGAVVLHDLPDQVTAYGVPCRVQGGRMPGDSYL